jgi:glycosyltransferase involved in cell wall biosynthesis
MRVLFLTPQLPYPQVSGGAIKSFKLIEYLSGLHQLTLGCFLKSAEEQDNLKAFVSVSPSIKVFSHPLDIERTFLNLLKSYAHGVPLSIFRNQSIEFKQKVAALADQHDLIFVDHYLMFQYVPENFKGRVIVHQHNAEFVMWSRLAQQIFNPVKKALLLIEAHRIRKYELSMCQQVDAILAAPNDKKELIALGADKKKFIETLHLGDEQNLHLQNIRFDQTTTDLLFIGTLTWEANIDGLVWFLKEIWPLIKKLRPEVGITIAGKHTEQLGKKLYKLEPKIKLLGFVEDLESLYQRHRVFIAPLRFGSGIKVKVINGLYRGIPTVTTPIGVEGLELTNYEHLLIEDNPQSFASSVLNLLENKPLWEKISLQSRIVMKQNYTWDKILKNVNRSLSDGG